MEALQEWIERKDSIQLCDFSPKMEESRLLSVSLYEDQVLSLSLSQFLSIFFYQNKSILWEMIKGSIYKISHLHQLASRVLLARHGEQSFLPHWVCATLSRHFSEIKAIWLAFDSLFYFMTEHLILRGKGEKSSKYPFWKDLGFGGYIHKGKVLAPFMSVVLYGNLLVLFNILCYNLLILKKKS